MSAKHRVVVDIDLEDIMPRFLEIRAAEAKELEAAIAARDMERVTFLGHRLKGTGGGYGLERLSELGAAIEAAGQNNDLDRAARALAEAEDYMANLEIVYEEME